MDQQPCALRPHLRGEVPLPRLAVERFIQMVHLYENWPTAILDRLRLMPKRWHVIYRVRSTVGSANLVARTNGCDVRTITEIWIGGFYDRLMPARSGSDAPAVILDIGANCGYFAAYIAQRYPEARVICFEPEANNRSLAEANLALNCKRSELRSEAVVPGDAMSVILNLSNDPRLHTTVVPAQASNHGLNLARYNGGAVEVVAVNISDVIKEVGKDPITLLKIDVEGIDLELVTSLPSKLLERISCVVVETESRDTVSATRHLEGSGFVVTEDAGLLFGSRRTG